LIILYFLLQLYLIMKIMELGWTLPLKSLYTLKTDIIIIILIIGMHRSLILIWSVIIKNTLKSLTASTLTLKQFIRNLINNILIWRKVIVKHMLTLKALWLIVISPFLFNVYWAISLSSILMIYLLKYYFLCFVIINLVRLHFWVYLFFLLLLCFVYRSFFSLEKLLKKFLFFLRHRLIIKHKFEI
jgi:hypothetical protein